MKRFAAIANAGKSHQMAMRAIGRELRKQGHDLLLLGTEYQKTQFSSSDLPFLVVGSGSKDPVRRYFERAAEQPNLPVSATVEYMKGMAQLLSAEAPALLKQENIDFVLADQEEPGAATAADLAGLPYATVCCSLPLNFDRTIPPGFFGWKYQDSVGSCLRNRLGYAVRNLVVKGVHDLLNVHRSRAGLPLYRTPEDSFSQRLQITQSVKEFDFPRKNLPSIFEYVGPFQREALSPVDFPYERLNGKPLIYASLGTTFGKDTGPLRRVAEACRNLDVQPVISLGGCEPAFGGQPFPGETIVVRYAPQRDLLSRCALAVTHAGLNTTLEALSFGVPLLALPIAGDQAGVAARISHHGVGIALGHRERTVDRIRQAIVSLLENSKWKAAAQRMQSCIDRTGGAAQAADRIGRLAT